MKNGDHQRSFEAKSCNRPVSKEVGSTGASQASIKVNKKMMRRSGGKSLSVTGAV